MGRSLKKSATSTGKILFVIGIGVGGWLVNAHRMRAVPRKPNAPSRVRRRREMREAMERAARDPEFIREMNDLAAEMDGAADDGLAHA